MIHSLNKWDTYFISVAKLTANLSYSNELKVGYVAVLDRRIICTGYNGTFPGMSNTCETVLEDGSTVTSPYVEHAERNLISYAAKKGIALEGAQLYGTHAPCENCARSIISAGFVKVSYAEEFKRSLGLELLTFAGVEICRL